MTPASSTLINPLYSLEAANRTPAKGSLENGYNESFTGKLQDELLNREIFYTLQGAQMLIELGRQEYNTVRPHSSLGYRPPVPETWLTISTVHGCAQLRQAPWVGTVPTLTENLV